MNSCVLMAKIVSDPELRYTQDNQMPITQMRIEIEGLGANDQPATLKAIGWGNMASTLKEEYKEGTQVIVMGRLSIRSFDHPEGFKEKRPELTISQIYPLTGWPNPPQELSQDSHNVVSLESFRPKSEVSESSESMAISETMLETQESQETESVPPNDQDLDDIPF